jgi:hypothetical protein
MLEFVAGFIAANGTVIYPDFGFEVVPGQGTSGLQSEGAVPLVKPGAYWIKVRLPTPRVCVCA